MKRSALRRSSQAEEPRAKALHAECSGRAREEHLLRKLQAELYRREEWALFTHVRNTTGAYDVIRTADALAIHLFKPVDGWLVHGFELKLSRGDFLREMRSPEKCGPLKLFCGAWWIVVVAPWGNVVHSLDELPRGWGLIELGPGGPRIVRPAEEREAEHPLPGFLKALFRRAMERRGEEEIGADDVPRKRITRIVDRWQVGLACGHVGLRTQAKIQPIDLPCFACRDGLPGDKEIVLAALDAATPEERRTYRARLDELDRTGCPCLDEDGGICAAKKLQELGATKEEAEIIAFRSACPCTFCHGPRGSK